MKAAKGTGIFRITVERIDRENSSGKHHRLDIEAGNWITALTTAADAPEEFEYTEKG